MIRRFSSSQLALQLLVDLLLTLAAIKVAEQLRIHITTGLERRGDYIAAVGTDVYLLVIGVWIFFFLLFGALDSRRGVSLMADLGYVWLSVTVSMLVVASLFYLLGLVPPAAPSRLFYLYFYAVDLLLLTCARLTTYRFVAILQRKGRRLRRVLLVGGGVHSRQAAVRLQEQVAGGLLLHGYAGPPDQEPPDGVRPLGDLADIPDIVRREQIDDVVIALPASAYAHTLQVCEQLQNENVKVHLLPDLFDLVAMRVRVEDFYGLPLISVREPSMTPVQARVKRGFDVLVAGALGLMLSPLALGIALWIRLDSPGPVMIHQRRVGAGGSFFVMHKFRTMVWNPEETGKASLKQPNDPRVTRAGRFLRRTSLDEIPQLWNVLKGEMSLVGPRPELPSIVETYQPWQLKRLAVPPGMTGWWQINGRAERPMHLNTEIDLFYVQNYSVLLDMQILARTLGTVIKGKGAY